jgi:hypothetical protein
MGGWAEYKVSARLVVDGKEFECVRANVSFQLNTIPQALFMVAVGRGKSEMMPAMIHKTDFGIQVPLQLYVQLKPLASGGENGQFDSLPVDEFRLFDGYLTGVSWNKTRQHEHAMLHAQHWLLDMDYSSAVSDMSHPLNPSQFSFKAAHLIPGTGGVSWLPQTLQGFVTPASLESDFWGDCIKPWMEAMTEQDLINNDDMSWIGPAHTNKTAAKALAKFSTGAGNYVPLAMDIYSTDPVAVSAAIWNDVQLEWYETMKNTTLWEKLVNDLGSRYMFAIVPRVEDAIVIPYIPGLAQIWNPNPGTVASILAKDYVAISANSHLTRMLRAVGIFSGLNSRTGADNVEPGQSPVRLGTGGLYCSSRFESGMIMFKQAPRWLSNIIASDRYSDAAAGAGLRPIGTAIHPGAGIDDGPPKPKDLQTTSKEIMDAYAQTLYVYEQLRLRQLELSGRFRLDLAPGSTVSIEVAGDRFIESDVLIKTLVGDITRVTYLIDSENSRCGTDFNLAHIRTVSENTSNDFALDRPPLWKRGWPGAGLLSFYDK